MRTLLVTVLCASVGLDYIEAFGQVGKCNTESLVIVPLPITEIEKHTGWRVAYATDPERKGDHESYKVRNLGGQNYKMTNRKVFKDKSEAKYGLSMKYVDNVLVEDFEDKKGEKQRVYLYPLAVTKSLVVLIYRCRDSGNPNVDYRFIAYPDDIVPDESEIQQVLAFDKATFPESRGTLIKLPEAIKD